MTAPVQEPTQARTDSGQEFRTRQLFRRPALATGSVRQTGWTVVFGDGTTPVVNGDYQAVWQITRDIVGDATTPWYIFDPSASVVTPPTVDIVIWLYRIRTDGTFGPVVSAILDSPITIDAGTYTSRVSVSPPVVTQFANLEDWDGGPTYDSIMVGIDSGDGDGLSMNVPIGIEQPAGSGYHIP